MSATTEKITHTPGPWSIGRTKRCSTHSGLPVSYETAVHVGEGDRRGNCLAIAYLGGLGATRSDLEHVEANARLIAAAPELLKALKEALQSLEYTERAHPNSSGSLKRWQDIERAQKAIAKATQP